MQLENELGKFDFNEPGTQYMAAVIRQDAKNGGSNLMAGKLDDEIRIGMQRIAKRGRTLKWFLKEPELRGAMEISESMLRMDKSDTEILEELRKHKTFLKTGSRLEQAKRYDAGTMSFERDNIYQDPRLFDLKHQPFTWRTILPIQALDPGATEVAYRQFDTSGEAQAGSAEDGSMHYITATGQEFLNKIVPFKVGYQETWEEVRKAAFQNAPITKYNVLAVNRAYETKLQKGAMLGHGGFDGFINSPNVPNVQAAAPATGTSRVWGAGDKIPTEVATDIMGMPTKIIDEQQSAYGKTGFVIALSAAKYRYIMTTKMGSADSGSDTTIAKYVLENDESIQGFEIIHELVGQGTTSSELAICYKRDSEYLEMQIADAVIWHAPQFQDLWIKHPSEMKFGGVVNRYPLAMTQLYGI